VSALSAVAPRTEYVELPRASELPADVLFAVRFDVGDAAVSPRCARVRLAPLQGAGLTEVWYANGPVTTGFAGPIRYAADEHFLAGAIEVDEREYGGEVQAATFAYRAIAEFQETSRFPHMLRTWNYMADINRGAGDAERYRGFCSGRVAGLARFTQTQFPAATAIGHRDAAPILQVYWLAGREPGVPLENPRQLSAYHYPRQYGPTAPTFSRAILVAPDLLMVSGTASIVGHESRHAGNVAQQLEEIFQNLDSLFVRAHEIAPALPARFSRHTLLKAYVRDPADLPLVDRAIRAHLPVGARYVALQGDVCRADLLVELDCLHAAD